MRKHTPYHRLLGVGLSDLFTGLPWQVLMEQELALKSQRLDLLIVERAPGAASAAADGPADLPDGLEKARRTTTAAVMPLADQWTGEWVEPTTRYRLQPAADFGLYAVATREPRGLRRGLSDGVWRDTAWPGVHDLRWGQTEIRLIVLEAIAPVPRNAFWMLFTASRDRVRFGLREYRPRDKTVRLLRYMLTNIEHLGLTDMSYTVEDFKREVWHQIIEDIGPAERLAVLDRMDAEERLALLDRMDTKERQALLDRMDTEERQALLDRMDTKERQALLDRMDVEERLRGLDVEERLRGMDPEQIRAYLRKLEH